MDSKRCRWSLERFIVYFLLGLSVVSFSRVLIRAEIAVAQSQSDGERDLQKEYWQRRYRSLLQEAERLRVKVAVAREAYAEANRRDYRRGKARHAQHEQMLEAESDLAEVQAKLDTIVDQGRRSGALPGWFYEVEDEWSSIPESVDDASGPAEADASDGRNPLYLDDVDELQENRP